MLHFRPQTIDFDVFPPNYGLIQLIYGLNEISLIALIHVLLLQVMRTTLCRPIRSLVVLRRARIQVQDDRLAEGIFEIGVCIAQARIRHLSAISRV